MKKLFTLTFYAVLIVSLCSCRSAVETMLLEESCSTSGIHLPMPSNPNNSSEIQVSTSNYNDRVDSTALPEDEGEMLRVMAAGNQFIAALQRGEQPMNASERFIMPDGGLDALAAFERFFFLDTLYVSGVLINPRKAEPYICIISGSGRHRGETQRVQVHFDRSEPMKWNCSLAYYNPLIVGRASLLFMSGTANCM